MKKLLSVALVIVLMLSVLPLGAFSITASAATSGTTGDCTWSLENNVLTISGDGAMEDYEYKTYAPWYNSRSSINKIVIEPGVTYISDYAFYYCYATEVIIGDDVIETGTYSFNMCRKLARVYLGKSVSRIGGGSFFNCESLTDVYYSGTAAQWNKITISSDNTYFKNASLHYTSVDGNNSVVIDPSRYIESEHPYPCNSDKTKTFTSPGAQSLTIAFGEKSRLGSYADYIYLYDGSGEELVKLTWTSAIANQSFTIQGDTFSIRLVTDNSGDSSKDFGYHFSSIVAHDVDVSDFMIEVKEAPTKKIYEVGEELNTEGLILSLIHFDGSVTEITSGYTVSGFDSETIGTKTVTVDYKGKTATFDVSVKTLIGKGTCGKNATWTLDDEGCLTISGTGAMKDYITSSNYAAPWNSLRGSINKIKISEGITYIGEYAFYQCYKPTTISVPKGVETIGDGAFSSCSGATYITLPDTVKTIGYKAFEGCTALQSITIPAGVTCIDAYTFYKCGRLSYVKLPNTISEIGNYAFSECTNLTTLSLPNNVTSIGERAFCDCSKLATIKIPSGVTEIKYAAFQYCTALTSISLPEGLTTIGDSAFMGCSNLEEINIPKTVTSMGSSAFSSCSIKKVNITDIAAWCNISFKAWSDSNPLSRKDNLYINGEKVTDLVIPNGVTKISTYAFCNCNSLKSVVIPDSVTTIGLEAFYNCANLERIELGKGVTEIGEGAFRYSSATEIIIPNSVTTIGKNAFSSSLELEKVTLGSNVESIESYAFSGCSNLKDVYYLGNETEREGISIASYNTPLTDAVWHYDSCIATEQHTYSYECDDTCNVCGKKRDATHVYTDLYDKYCNICNALREKPTGSTGDCIWTLDGTELTISGNGEMENYTSTGPWGNGITSVTIKNGVTSIGTSAFKECFNLYEVQIAGSVKTIGDDAFSCCTSLSGVAIPNGVVSIGSSAFEMCDLFGVYIPASVTNIGRNAFAYCWNLEQIKVHADNTVYSSDDFGILFDKNKTTILQAPYELSGEYIVPSSVTTISDSAFYSCDQLTKITISSDVTYIGGSAFSGCYQLTEITLPDTISNIGSAAFSSCYNLSVVYYLGSEAMRSEITIASHNTPLTDATWHYNSCIGTTAHIYEWVVDEENNCGVDGAKHEICIVCDFTRNVNTVIPATGNHKYDDFCDDVCNICGFNRIAPHSFVWVIDNQSTCGEEGTKHEECSACHTRQNENTSIPATGDHTYTWVVDQNPTCGAEGIKHEECIVCYIKRSENTPIDATGNHTYDDNCDTNCNVCDDIRTITHDYKWVVDKSATCDKSGVKHEECSVCHTIQNENTIISATGNHTYAWVIDLNPTCGAKGIKHQECTVCQLVRYENTEIAATGNHTFSGEYDLECDICNQSFYIITFMADQSSVYDKVRIEFGTIYTIPTESPTKNGYNFAGWALTSKGDVVYKSGDSLSIDKLLTLYAQWNKLCSICGGDKKIDCTNCSATGKIQKTCSYCGGSGFVVVGSNHISICEPYTYSKCGYCSGKGYKNCSTCNENGEVIRENVAAPSAPILVSVDSTTVILQAITNGEYSLDGITWQDSPIFKNLETGKEYTFYQRYVKTDTTYTSASSLGLKVVAHSHTYDNACDAKCNICGHTRSVPDHVYDNACDTTCNICNYVRTVPDHVYDNNCDTDCNVCGYGRTVPDHIYDNVCDESCNECGAIRGIEHLYDMECDITCNKCGGIREVPHFYDDASDSICNRCGHNRNKASGKTGDCDWYIIDDTLYITGNGAMGEYTYSSTLPWGNTFTQVVIKNGVTTVGNYAFYYCSKLTSVTIPNSVISIGAYAFQNCTSLVNVNLGKGVTTIGNYAFYSCSAITSLDIPDSVKSIGNYAFGYCSSLVDVIIGNGVTTIGNYGFYDCHMIRTVVVPDSVTSIGEYAFGYCLSLGSAFIGKGITKITSRLFYYCCALESITIPNSITAIGAGAFYNCSALDSVYITDLKAWCGIDFADYDDNPLYRADNLYLNGEKVTELIVPSGTTTIKKYAFAYFDGFSSVTIPSSVASICDYAFYYCKGITSVRVDDGVESIGAYAFYDCDNLTDVAIPNSVTSIGSYAFADCDNLVTVVIGSGNTQIGSYAFNRCTSLSSLTMQNGVKTIGSHAFAYCEGLTSVIIPDSVTSIGDYAFSNCYNLEIVIIGDGITQIAPDLFWNSPNITDVTIGKSVTQVGAYAFYSCSKLKDVWYKGDSQSNISIASGNSYLTNTSWHYNVDVVGKHIYDSVCDIFCNICSDMRTVLHVYDNACDKICNVCGTTRTVPEHIYDNMCDFDCNSCGLIRTVPDHVYDDVCDTTCNICSKIRTVPHFYDNDCDTTCNKCYAERTVGDHVYSNDCDANCNICNSWRNAPHIYDNVCDAICNGCGITRTVPDHVYDNACDSICNICGFVRAVPDHIYDDACDTDCNICSEIRTVPHFYDNDCDKNCNNCYAERAVGDHVYSNGCDADCNICGNTRTPDKHAVGFFTLDNATNYPFVLNDGIYSSTNKYNSSSATVTLTFIKSGSIKISYCTSTEENYGKLIISHNGITKVEASGEIPWTDITIQGVAGDKIYITYSKDSSQNYGSDEVNFSINPTAGFVFAEDLEPTCKDAVICDVCGAIVKPVLEHNYDHDCDNDCNYCGEIREVADHIYDNACDGVCNVVGCGYTREVEDHKYTHEADKSCDICGAEREVIGVMLVEENGQKVYYVDGVKQTEVTELVKIDGTWYYISNGVWDTSIDTLHKINGKWFLIQKGIWKSFTGLTEYKGKTFYIQGGKWFSTVKGVKKVGSTYYLIKGGKWSKTTEIYKDGSTYYYIKSGKWSKTTNIVKIGSTSYYIKSGKWSKTTGIVKIGSTQYYVKSGKWTKTTTLYKKSGKYYAIKSGKVTKSKVIIKYNGKKYYCYKGYAQTSYSGKVTVSGKKYTVKKGIVK